MARRSFAAAIKAGGLPALEAVRDAIADDLGRCESYRDRCGLYLRLTDVLARVEAARAAVPGSGDAVDQLKQRRARRLGPAGTTPRTLLLSD